MSPIQKAQAVNDAHQTLGVGAHATDVEIRDAWKKLAFAMHPDRGVGSDAELANINAAYSLLKERAVSRPLQQPANAQAAAKPATAPNAGKVSPRPSLKPRVTDLGENALNELAEIAGDEGHFAHRVERLGRKVVYFVETPLSAGKNTVVVPTGQLIDGRSVAPQSLTFKASTGGNGKLNVPESMLKSHFPGATAVTICFGA